MPPQSRTDRPVFCSSDAQKSRVNWSQLKHTSTFLIPMELNLLCRQSRAALIRCSVVEFHLTTFPSGTEGSGTSIIECSWATSCCSHNYVINAIISLLLSRPFSWSPFIRYSFDMKEPIHYVPSSCRVTVCLCWQSRPTRASCVVVCYRLAASSSSQDFCIIYETLQFRSDKDIRVHRFVFFPQMLPSNWWPEAMHENNDCRSIRRVLGH
jgi:hypothetical protein